MSAEDKSAPVWRKTGERPCSDAGAAMALKAAAACYTADEFRVLERDLEAGRVDVRVYDDGLVIMRVPAPQPTRSGYTYGGE